MPRSPRRRIRLATVVDELAALRSPVGLKTPPSTRHQQRVSGPHGFAVRGRLSLRNFDGMCTSAEASAKTGTAPFVCARSDGSQASLPCHRRHATALPRPPHPIPTFVTIAKRPSCGTGCATKATDLPAMKSEIFRSRGLDRANRIDLARENSVLARRIVSPMMPVLWILGTGQSTVSLVRRPKSLSAPLLDRHPS
jgi:hypothetical protein